MTSAGRAPAGPAPTRSRATLVVLVLANLLPLGMVAAGLWDVAEVVLFYWYENVVIGLFNVLRIATATKLAPGERAGLAAFFSVHYGIFCIGHLTFLVDAFGYPGVQPGQPVPGGGFVPFDLIADPGMFAPPRFHWPLLSLVASHGFSFVSSYLFGGERLSATQSTLMGRPYGRVVVMHLWLFLGGFMIMKFQAPMAALVVLVVLKTALDASTHAYLHRSRS